MSWIWNNVADAFSQLLFIKNITYRCILESLFLFQLKTTKKNVPWDGEHLFQSLMCQYFSGHGGILIYEFIARKGKKNQPIYSLSENVQKNWEVIFTALNIVRISVDIMCLIPRLLTSTRLGVFRLVQDAADLSDAFL